MASAITASVPILGRRPRPEVERVRERRVAITPLGAGREVGKSCILVQCAGKTVLLDCGVAPSLQGIESLPALDCDQLDVAAIDLVIVSHFHLDHAAGLPYLTECTAGFAAPVFATHATLAVMKMLLADSARVAESEGDPMYTAEQGEKCLTRIEPVDFRQKITQNGITFTLFPAGHVLGAAMVLLEIEGISILYTGDYSAEEDRHLMAASVPPNVRAQVLITESTFGIRKLQHRATREEALLSAVRRVVMRGGNVLMPVFALGRAQELLLILEEYWQDQPELQGVPIYHSTGLSANALIAYSTFVHSMNERVQTLAQGKDPWKFKFIKPWHRGSPVGPAVVLATPGMLQQGTSRHLLDDWVSDSKNGVVLTGFSAKGTLARQLQERVRTMTTLAGDTVDVRATVEDVSFAAHVDGVDNIDFVKTVDAPFVVLVHGESSEMDQLQGKLYSVMKERPEFADVFAPANMQCVNVQLLDTRAVQLRGFSGSLQGMTDASGTKRARLSGVLVKRGFEHTIVPPEEVSKHTTLVVHRVKNTTHVPYHAPFAPLVAALAAMFGEVSRLPARGERHEPGCLAAPGLAHELDWSADSMTSAASWAASVADGSTIRVCGEVEVQHNPSSSVTVSWGANPTSDMVADGVLAAIAAAIVSPTTLKVTSRPCGCGGHA